MKLSTLFARRRRDSRPVNSRRRNRRPLVEPLEGRSLLAVILSDAIIGEGGLPGTQSLVFTATLDPPSTETITFNYATEDGTASAGNDYTAIESGVLTFDPGQTEKTITVTVISDNLDEANETLLLRITDPSSSETLTEATGTITDDDPQPGFSIGNATVVEGNTGTRTLSFSVLLAAASGQAVTVQFNTATDPSADGPAIAGSDYLASSGQLTFAPGDTEETISIIVLSDSLNEEDETFLVNLTGPVNTTLDDGQAIGTITNDDAAPALSINDVSLSEGNAGTKTATFTVRLSAASGQTVTTFFETNDNTATAASDYAPASGMLTFQPGETTKTIAVTVNGDTRLEANETFFVALHDQSNATIADAVGVGTITNDDQAPRIFITGAIAAEPASGSVPAKFGVGLSNASDTAITVNFATVGGTALAGSDFTASSGQLTFAPGEIFKTIDVDVLADTSRETVERFVVNLTTATNASLGNSQAVGTIYDWSRPHVTTISRAQGPVGSEVRINGFNFRNVSVVRFGGAAAQFRIVSAKLIIAIVPAGARSGPISLTNSGGVGSSSQSFGVVPRITAFTPTRARVGSTVAINGKGLGEVTEVLFNGTPATILSVTPNLVRVRVPAGATTGPIQVVSTVASHSTAGLATPNFRVLGSASAAEIDAVFTLEGDLSGGTSSRPGGRRR